MTGTVQPLQSLSLLANIHKYEQYELLVCGYIREWEFRNLNNTSNMDNATSISHGIPHEIIELIYILYAKHYESILSSNYCGNDLNLIEDFLSVTTLNDGKGIVRCTDALMNGTINIWYVTFMWNTVFLNYATSMGVISHSTPDACYSTNMGNPYHPYYDCCQSMHSGALYFGLGLDKAANSWTAATKCHKCDDVCSWYQPLFTRGHTIKIVCDLRENRNCLSFYLLTDKSDENIDEDNDEHQNVKRIGLPSTYSKENACDHDLRIGRVLNVEIGDEIVKEESENDLIVDYTYKLPNDRQYIWYPCLAPWSAGLSISFDNTRHNTKIYEKTAKKC